MKNQTVIFIGPQGSGKGTQVANFTQHLREQDADTPVIELETGKYFRSMMEADNFTAARIKATLADGKLMPDFFAEHIVILDLADRLTENCHLTMDGFPRNMAQVAFIDELLAFYGREDITVVFLDTPEEIVRERMLGRGRSDDTPEAIDERLRLYKQDTEPIIAEYKSRDSINFIHIDGNQTIEAIQAEIRSGLSA